MDSLQSVLYIGLMNLNTVGHLVAERRRAKGLTLRMGQTHVHRYMKRLLGHIQNGDIDPRFVISHRLPLEQAPAAYRTFRAKQDGCIKVVMKP